VLCLCTAGSSTGEVSLWLADPSAPTAAAALTQLGTALLPDQQAALVLDLIVVAAGGSNGGSSGWQLLLAAGKTMGKAAVWRSGLLIPSKVSSPPPAAAAAGTGGGGLTRQQLALAVSGGVSASRQCHGMTGFVTGVLWNPWEQLLCSTGADGQMLTWSWGPTGLEVRGTFVGWPHVVCVAAFSPARPVCLLACRCC
jgi:hypothetical protein